MLKTYTQLSRLSSFQERFNYLALHGGVGRATFGSERHLNQRFYTSREWKQVRSFVIARDYGCDLGMEGHEIHAKILIHHLNPITPQELVQSAEETLDPEYLITTCHNTHNAIHYGNFDLIPKPYVARQPNDTTLW